MIEPGDGQAASQPAPPEPPPACPPIPVVLLSVIVLFGSFAALFYIDIPILWFLRSHNLSALQSLGDLGEKLGNGGTSSVVPGQGSHIREGGNGGHRWIPVWIRFRPAIPLRPSRW